MLPNLYNASTRRNNQIQLACCDVTKKIDLDLQIVIAEENSSWA